MTRTALSLFHNYKKTFIPLVQRAQGVPSVQQKMCVSLSTPDNSGQANTPSSSSSTGVASTCPKARPPSTTRSKSSTTGSSAGGVFVCVDFRYAGVCANPGGAFVCVDLNVEGS